MLARRSRCKKLFLLGISGNTDLIHGTYTGEQHELAEARGPRALCLQTFSDGERQPM